MTQTSYFWDDNGIGDGQAYSFDDWNFLWGLMFSRDRTTMGIIKGLLNEVEVTANGAQTVQIDTGWAIVNGKIYHNPVAYDISGLGLTATGQIILRTTIATGVVRAFTKAIGALTQTAAVWEIQIATWSTDGAGVVTVVKTAALAVSPLISDAAEGFGDFQIIETIDADGTSVDFDFTSIPGTFDHLMVQYSMRTNGVIASRPLFIQINGDVGNNYNMNDMRATKDVYSGTVEEALTQINIGNAVGGNGLINAFSPGKFWIPNYLNTNFWKGVISENSCIPANATSIHWIERISVAQWMDSSAINRIKIYNSGGDIFTVGSSVTLYGIKS